MCISKTTWLFITYVYFFINIVILPNCVPYVTEGDIPWLLVIFCYLRNKMFTFTFYLFYFKEIHFHFIVVTNEL